MPRFYIRLALALLLILILLISMIEMVMPIAPPYLDELRAFLLSPQCRDFQTPCWLGIRIGQTSPAQAQTILEMHPYVRNVRVEVISTSDRRITWQWAEDAPFFLKSGKPSNNSLGLTGGAESGVFFDVTATRIYLTGLNIPLTDFWYLLGDPQTVSIWQPQISFQPHIPPSPGSPRLAMGFQLHPTGLPGLRASGEVTCPLTPYRFWSGQVESIYVGSSERFGYEYRPDFYEDGCTPTVRPT